MILFLSTADTEILSLRSIAEAMPQGFPALRAANPSAIGEVKDLDGVRLIVVRLLGGKSAWDPHFEHLAQRCAKEGIALAAFGGEATSDPDLLVSSTISPEVSAVAFEYLVQGGLFNLEHCLRYLSDQTLATSFGYDPPRSIAEVGVLARDGQTPQQAQAVAGRSQDGLPKVGIVFYRAHVISGNTQFIDQLCEAVERAGGQAIPVWCYSLRPAVPGGPIEAIDLLGQLRVDSVITTVWASGSSSDDGAAWDSTALSTLGVPVVQAVASTISKSQWEQSPAGLAPMDVAMSVAIPEFDGRIVAPAFSFKEVVDDGADLGSSVTAYRVVAERAQRVADIAVRLASLASKPCKDRKVAIVLSAYPTKRSRLGNAVGLDTPASAINLLQSLRTQGYKVDSIAQSGDELMAKLADGLTYDLEDPTADQVQCALAQISLEQYGKWFSRIPKDAQADVEQRWGAAPGRVGVADGKIVLAGLDLGNVLVAIQPPRGHGIDPIALYHSPDLAPTHQYIAFYRWLDEAWGADAVIHLGKHGTLEWLPGKSVGLSESCFPDIVLGSIPFIYPFVVNDPGEGTQAKRRAHAVIVDHLVPPLTRADSYGGIARLEELLDTHAQVAAMDPSKLSSIREQVWEVMVSEKLQRDLGLTQTPKFEDDSFDELVLEVDGYLCELKDAQIRGGLHILGEPPTGAALVDMVLALTRLEQGKIPSLRSAVANELGISLACASRVQVDRIEQTCKDKVQLLASRNWIYEGDDRTLSWICERLIPAINGTTGEISSISKALSGRHIEAGPSGSPSRGGAHVLPTGRNFYSLDPQAVPSRLAWEVGKGLADQMCITYRESEGDWPASVGLVAWGTAAMRTGGDDVAQVLALMGTRPVWSQESGRVVGVEVIALEELKRPRVDVTLRISGFFRDAFPHVVKLIDEAAEMVAVLDEAPEVNPLAANGLGPRIFGPKPGAYGSGVLAVLESGQWNNQEDLANVWLSWSGWSYGRSGMGQPAEEALRERIRGLEIAAKNQDNREHDIFDSDDYLQDHGGMVAAVAALGGRAPLALFGDSADPSNPKVRTLAQEAARVVRSRVVNPKWLDAMRRHGYKGAFEMAATVDYLFGYDATANVVEDWMYERVTETYVADPINRAFFSQSSPWALSSIAQRLLEAAQRGMWNATQESLDTLRNAILEAESWEEAR